MLTVLPIYGTLYQAMFDWVVMYIIYMTVKIIFATKPRRLGCAFCKPTFNAPMCWVNDKAVNPTYSVVSGISTTQPTPQSGVKMPSRVGWVAAFCNPTLGALMCWVNDKTVNPTYSPVVIGISTT